MFCVEEEEKTNEPCIIMELCTGSLIYLYSGIRDEIQVVRSIMYLRSPSTFMDWKRTTYESLFEMSLPACLTCVKKTSFTEISNREIFYCRTNPTIPAGNWPILAQLGNYNPNNRFRYIILLFLFLLRWLLLDGLHLYWFLNIRSKVISLELSSHVWS